MSDEPKQATTEPTTTQATEQSAAGQEKVQPEQSAASSEKLPEGMRTLADGKIQVLSTSAYKRLKEEARARGQREALDSLSKELGMSVDDMRKKLKGEPQEPSSKQKPQPKPEQGKRNENSAEQDKRWLQAQRERDEFAKRAVAESRAARRAKRELDSLNCEMALLHKLHQAGVTDTEVALHLLKQKTQSLTEEQLKTFEETKLFEEWRKTRPYLWGETSQAATTGQGKGSPPALKAGEATTQAAKNGQVDAMKMSRQEFQAYLSAKGINPDHS